MELTNVRSTTASMARAELELREVATTHRAQTRLPWCSAATGPTSNATFGRWWKSRSIRRAPGSLEVLLRSVLLIKVLQNCSTTLYGEFRIKNAVARTCAVVLPVALFRLR